MARTFRLTDVGTMAFHFFGKGTLVYLFADAPTRARSAPLRSGAETV
ncbi:hypothetical protein ND748_03840 [Frankia sp. AiPs1]|nr:hypothetical protein [Frankia sp. AiPs1]MCM3920809.1 hypothetical protein [Frankia sp. AiPs1]